MQKERIQLVAEIVAWLRDVVAAEPDAPKAAVYREIAADIEQRWSTGEFSTDKLR